MLRPFESRFSGLKERISKHRAWFEAEAHIHQHGLISETYTSFREFLKVTEGDPLDQSRSLRADNGNSL